MTSRSDLESQERSELAPYTTNSGIWDKHPRVVVGLQASRDFIIPDRREQVNGTSDFELITWLVIKEN